MLPVWPWSPIKLPGVVFAYRASVGATLSGANVTALADQGPRQISLTSEGAGNVVLSSNAIGTMPGMTFSATSKLVNTGVAQLVGNKADRHYFSVTKPVTIGGALITHPYGGTSNATYYLRNMGGLVYVLEANRCVTPPTIANISMVADTSVASNVVAAAMNGTDLPLNSTVKAGEANGVGLIIGSWTTGTSYFQGLVCEVWMFSRKLTTKEAADVRHYFGNLYGITIAN